MIVGFYSANPKICYSDGPVATLTLTLNLNLNPTNPNPLGPTEQRTFEIAERAVMIMEMKEAKRPKWHTVESRMIMENKTKLLNTQRKRRVAPASRITLRWFERQTY